ncbi:cell division suppressor protein YneA [Planococcus sp. CAU13]|uniref:cell division suppressor protein YneA n=1 Tax=Planococcus sp. CAU13 TaxID=1541197 RepID=UPI00052FFB5B|nr:LysM peptidoglycan-binding domain-containing protein [Planococcus sp. CAU13]
MATLQKNSFVILFFALILLLSFYSVFSHNNDQARMVQLKIEQGDTLWTLADEFSGNTPHHEWIDEIMKENQLDAPVITAGQTLAIPEKHLKFAPDQNLKLASDSE